MIGIGCAVEVSLMTVDTVLVEPGKNVVDVAAGAGNGLVCPDKRKCRVGVIERRGGPNGRRMALIARLRESPCGVIWIACALVVCLVTRVTVRV